MNNRSFADIRVGEPPEPTEEAQVRRQMADSLKTIIDRLVRMDAPMDRLQDYANRLAGLAADIQSWKRRPLSGILQRLINGKGSQQDLLDLLDNEIMTGRGTPFSPPMSLWLDGNEVRGEVTLGVPWQGPPGRVHGGVIGLIMDILLAKTQDMVTGVGMTGTLNIRYLGATPLKMPVDLYAQIDRLDGRKMFCSGSIRVEGKPVVQAEGIWICASGNYQWKDAFAPREEIS